MPRNPDRDLSKNPKKSRPGEKPELERRYGSIGIPAVAAAARYHGEADERSESPATPARDHRREDA